MAHPITADRIRSALGPTVLLADPPAGVAVTIGKGNVHITAADMPTSLELWGGVVYTMWSVAVRESAAGIQSARHCSWRIAAISHAPLGESPIMCDTWACCQGRDADTAMYIRQRSVCVLTNVPATQSFCGEPVHEQAVSALVQRLAAYNDDAAETPNLCLVKVDPMHTARFISAYAELTTVIKPQLRHMFLVGLETYLYALCLRIITQCPAIPRICYSGSNDSFSWRILKLAGNPALISIKQCTAKKVRR